MSIIGTSAATGNMQRISFWIRIRNVWRYVQRGDISGLLARLSYHRREAYMLQVRRRLQRRSKNVWGIITPPHTLFVAQTIADRLAELEISSEVMTKPPDFFDHDFYFVLGAQTFGQLPPGEKRIVFQLEQSVSDRWFTDSYFSTLRNSVATLDYSLTNIRFLDDNNISYPHVHYLPIGASSALIADHGEIEKEYDFLFYGDSYSSTRRRKMLDVLQAHFKVKICNEIFGDDMHDLIRKSRAVINLHYYENALLETPRIQECLSLGVPLLSETAQNQDEYPELNGAVTFFEEGSIEGMLITAREILDNIDTATAQVAKSVVASSKQFRFMLDRFLVAIDALPASHWQDNSIYLEWEDQPISLSLPETIERRTIFTSNAHEDCVIFDGIRHPLGWVGCGLSYKTLAMNALSHGLPQLTVFEDDAIFTTDHTDKVEIVRRYLRSRAEPWDIFAGVIASVHPNTKILSVEELDGITFVTIDHMTSMVYNIYNRSALELLARWDPMNTDPHANTIDKFLENQTTVQVVVAVPFLVGHREEVQSTLWGFQNNTYSKMIAESEGKIIALARDWTDARRTEEQ
jgi:hypothetical protein